MIPLKNKRDFVKVVLEKKYLIHYELERFLIELLNKDEYLEKINFFDGKTNHKIKYKLHIDIQKNKNSLYFFDEKVSVFDNYFYILMHINTLSMGELAICIINPYKSMKEYMYDCFVNYYTHYNETFNAYIELVIRDSKISNLKEKINKSLEQKNKDLFLQLTQEYNEIMKGWE